MELCSQSEGNWLHQSEIQMSGTRAVNLEGFKNTACLNLEMESVSTLMWSSEKWLFVLHKEDEAILLPLPDITQNFKGGEPVDCGPASRLQRSFSSNLASVLQLWCCCCRASVCTGSVCCLAVALTSFSARCLSFLQTVWWACTQDNYLR